MGFEKKPTIKNLNVIPYLNTILVKWDDIRAADKYEIRYSLISDFTDAKYEKVSVVEYLVEGLWCNTEYFIQVRTKYEGKWGDWSEMKKTKTASYTVSVGSYNILSSKYDYVFPNNTWDSRKKAVGEILLRQDNSPDILSIQEGMETQQVENLISILKRDYDYYISEKNISPRVIFWKREQFELISYKDTINLLNQKIKGYKTTRYAIMVRLREKESKSELLVFNIHAPSSFGKNNSPTRLEIAENLSQIAKEESNKNDSIPILLTGDFNSPPRSVGDNLPTPTEIFQQEGFKDSFEHANDKMNAGYGTHDRITLGIATSGKVKNNPTKRIDYIMVYSPQKVLVSNYFMFIDFRENSGRYLENPIPSDHRPIKAIIHFW